MPTEKFRPYEGRCALPVSGYQVVTNEGEPVCRIDFYNVSHGQLCSVCIDDPRQSGGAFVAAALHHHGINPDVVVMSPFQTYRRQKNG